MLSLHFFKVGLGLARGLASKRHEVHVKLLASLDACCVPTESWPRFMQPIESYIRELANISKKKIHNPLFMFEFFVLIICKYATCLVCADENECVHK